MAYDTKAVLDMMQGLHTEDLQRFGAKSISAALAQPDSPGSQFLLRAVKTAETMVQLTTLRNHFISIKDFYARELKDLQRKIAAAMHHKDKKEEERERRELNNLEEEQTVEKPAKEPSFTALIDLQEAQRLLEENLDYYNNASQELESAIKEMFAAENEVVEAESEVRFAEELLLEQNNLLISETENAISQLEELRGKKSEQLRESLNDFLGERFEKETEGVSPEEKQKIREDIEHTLSISDEDKMLLNEQLSLENYVTQKEMSNDSVQAAKDIKAHILSMRPTPDNGNQPNKENEVYEAKVEKLAHVLAQKGLRRDDLEPTQFEKVVDSFSSEIQINTRVDNAKAKLDELEANKQRLQNTLDEKRGALKDKMDNVESKKGVLEKAQKELTSSIENVNAKRENSALGLDNSAAPKNTAAQSQHENFTSALEKNIQRTSDKTIIIQVLQQEEVQQDNTARSTRARPSPR